MAMQRVRIGSIGYREAVMAGNPAGVRSTYALKSKARFAASESMDCGRPVQPVSGGDET